MALSIRRLFALTSVSPAAGQDEKEVDSTSIELPGSRITAVTVDGDRVRVEFEPAYLVKHMTGSVERTRWRQNGALVFDGATLDPEAALPRLPADCAGGDVGENVYTYRDMIPVPLESRGHAHCALRIGEDGEIRIDATAVRLEMIDVPKYIEHIRPD
jgi:hypothetical protein